MEILQMKAEFLKDDNGNIWFFYASNIQARSRFKNAAMNQQMGGNSLAQESKSKAELDDKDEMLAEIEEYQEEANSVQNKCIDRMLGVMDEYYSNMKLEMGIAEQQRLLMAEQEGSNDDALRLDDVLTKLRPNTTAKNFREFLLRSDNINKTAHWRKVSRKVNPQLTNNSQQSGGVSP